LNFAFIVALQSNNYGVMIVSRDWLNDPYWEYVVQTLWGEFGPPLNAQFAGQMWAQSYAPTSNDSVHFDRLSKDDCFARYNVAYLKNAPKKHPAKRNGTSLPEDSFVL
jgi:hypothetical protein